MSRTRSIMNFVFICVFLLVPMWFAMKDPTRKHLYMFGLFSFFLLPSIIGMVMYGAVLNTGYHNGSVHLQREEYDKLIKAFTATQSIQKEVLGEIRLRIKQQRNRLNSKLDECMKSKQKTRAECGNDPSCIPFKFIPGLGDIDTYDDPDKVCTPDSFVITKTDEEEEGEAPPEEEEEEDVTENFQSNSTQCDENYMCASSGDDTFQCYKGLYDIRDELKDEQLIRTPLFKEMMKVRLENQPKKILDQLDRLKNVSNVQHTRCVASHKSPNYFGWISFSMMYTLILYILSTMYFGYKAYVLTLKKSSYRWIFMGITFLSLFSVILVYYLRSYLFTIKEFKGIGGNTPVILQRTLKRFFELQDTQMDSDTSNVIDTLFYKDFRCIPFKSTAELKKVSFRIRMAIGVMLFQLLLILYTWTKVAPDVIDPIQLLENNIRWPKNPQDKAATQKMMGEIFRNIRNTLKTREQI